MGSNKKMPLLEIFGNYPGYPSCRYSKKINIIVFKSKRETTEL
jgi:hypothetical protein